MYDIFLDVPFGAMMRDRELQIEGRLLEVEVHVPALDAPDAEYGLVGVLAVPRIGDHAEFAGDFSQVRTPFNHLDLVSGERQPNLYHFQPKYICGDMIRSIVNPTTIYGAVFCVKMRHEDITYQILHPDEPSMSITLSEQWTEPMNRPNIFQDRAAVAGMGFSK